MSLQCEAFNAAHPVGSTIRVWPGERRGDPVEVEVRYPAQVLSGHTPVVYVTGGHGCIALTHVEGQAHR
jgi:hypothetical protein